MAVAVRCLTPQTIETLKKAADRGDLAISNLRKMDSAGRRDAFAQYVDDDMAKWLNTKFENALIQTQKDAFLKWRDNVLLKLPKKGESPVLRRAELVKKITEKIEKMSQNDLFLGGDKKNIFLEDLIESKMGFHVTEAESKKIIELTDNLKKWEPFRVNPSTGEVTRGGKGTMTNEFFEAYNALDKYMESLAPSHNLKVLTSVIGRGNLLASLKSPVTNIVGNTTVGIAESLTRRLTAMQWTGYNKDLAMKIYKSYVDTYKKTGFDQSRMLDLHERHKIKGERITSSEGPGNIRKVGRFYSKWIFDKMLGLPDAAFAAAAFTDSIYLNAAKLARRQKVPMAEREAYTRELMLDAANITPLTKDGQILRERAIADATRSTFTDSTLIANKAMLVRNSLNKLTGDVRLGDLMLPFVKTPANVVARSLEYSGLHSVFDGLVLLRDHVRGEGADPKKVRQALDNLVRAGFGWIAMLAFSQLFKSEEFVGEYAFTTQKERELIELKGAGYNTIKIGDRWVSMDYFGPFAGPLLGIMNAKKYGEKNIAKMTQKYVEAVGSQVVRIPGVSELKDVMDSLFITFNPDSDKQRLSADYMAGFIDFAGSRVAPSIVSDVTKGLMDRYERQADYRSVKGGVERVKRKLPIASTTVPEKINIFGEKIKTQDPLTQLMFGARMRKDRADEFTNELNRLNDMSELPAVSDIRYVSDRAKELQRRIGRKKMNEAVKYFGEEWKRSMTRIMNLPIYQRATDESKKDLWNQARKNALAKMLAWYDAQYPPPRRVVGIKQRSR